MTIFSIRPRPAHIDYVTLVKVAVDPESPHNLFTRGIDFVHRLVVRGVSKLCQAELRGPVRLVKAQHPARPVGYESTAIMFSRIMFHSTRFLCSLKSGQGLGQFSSSTMNVQRLERTTMAESDVTEAFHYTSGRWL